MKCGIKERHGRTVEAERKELLCAESLLPRACACQGMPCTHESGPCLPHTHTHTHTHTQSWERVTRAQTTAEREARALCPALLASHQLASPCRDTGAFLAPFFPTFHHLASDLLPLLLSPGPPSLPLSLLQDVCQPESNADLAPVADALPYTGTGGLSVLERNWTH